MMKIKLKSFQVLISNTSGWSISRIYVVSLTTHAILINHFLSEYIQALTAGCSAELCCPSLVAMAEFSSARRFVAIRVQHLQEWCLQQSDEWSLQTDHSSDCQRDHSRKGCTQMAAKCLAEEKSAHLIAQNILLNSLKLRFQYQRNCFWENLYTQLL